MFNMRHLRPTISIIRVSDGRRLAGGEIFAKTLQRKPHVLVLIPAGAPWKHQSIQLYKQPWEIFINEYFNIGDMMVYDSTLKLLDYADFDVADLRNVTEESIERYNSNFDYCLLRGSNYINEGMDWENTRSLLERLHLPVYVIGVGAQAASARKLRLSEDSVAIWKLISERCGSIGVRGSFTADTLDSLGIKNVDIIGCPSLFRSREREMSLRVKDVRDIRHVAFSLRREVDASYSGNMEAYLENQRSAMLRLARECRRLTVTIHGEPEEKAFYFRDLHAKVEATERLRQSGWFTSSSERELLEIYNNNLYMYTRADDYDTLIRSVDFAIGYRVHGVLPALANGTPGALVNYDVRSAELAQTHGIPLIKENEIAQRSWREIYAELDFAKFDALYKRGYDLVSEFLSRNGIANRL